MPSTISSLNGLPIRLYLGLVHGETILGANIFRETEAALLGPWNFRRARRSAVIPDGTTPGGRRYRCSEISSYAKAQELLRQGHSYLDGNGDGEACASLR